MSPQDICGPYPAASSFADSYVDGNGATIYSPLTPAQNALYLAAVSKYQQCLAGVQQTPACPLGEYFAGSLVDGRWLGHCVSNYTGQPTTPEVSIPVGSVPGMAPLTGTNPPGTVSPPPAPVITPPLPVLTPPPATTKPPASSPAGLKAHEVPSVNPFTPIGGIGTYCDLYPDDPTCSLWGHLSGFGGILSAPQTIENTVVIYQAGLLASDIHAVVNGALSGLWTAVVGAVNIAFGGAIAGIQNAVTGLGNALKAAWNILTRMAGLMLKFLGHMFYTVIQRLILAIQDVTSWLKELYDNVLKPLVHLMQQIRQKLLDIYQRFLRPMLVVIEDIRRVLNVLAAFHVPFAAKLDAKLADLERRITAPFFTLLSLVNQVANWMNLIVTARYLFQRPIFLASLKAYIGSILHLQMNSMTKPLSAADLARLQFNGTLLTTSQSIAAGSEYIQFGTGANAAIIDQQAADLRRFLQEGF